MDMRRVEKLIKSRSRLELRRIKRELLAPVRSGVPLELIHIESREIVDRIDTYLRSGRKQNQR